MSFAVTHLEETKRIIDGLDVAVIDRMAELLAKVRSSGGRLFFLGVGGSAGNCSHAVNDFRKIAGIEAYAPTDNVSELTARTNDEGWETVFVEWLKVSRLRPRGRASLCFRSAAAISRRTSARTWCGRCNTPRKSARPFSASSAATAATRPRWRMPSCIIPTVNPEAVTPHSEAFQAVVWHLLVSPPGAQGAADEVGRGALSLAAPAKRFFSIATASSMKRRFAMASPFRR